MTAESDADRAARLRARIANPPQATPIYPEDGGKPIDPRLKMEVIDAMEHLLSSPASGTPTLATEEQVNKVLASMLAGESLDAPEGEPWASIVTKAVRSYAFYFGSMPDRQRLDVADLPPRNLEDYESLWNRADSKIDLFESDNLPQTHDNHDRYGELMPPWNPSVELNVPAVVSTSRAGHRWPLRGTTTVESVMDIVESDKWCDLNYQCCPRSTKPTILNTFVFAHGDLIVITHVCRECWQRWLDDNIPEPPEETIYEIDVQDSYNEGG